MARSKKVNKSLENKNNQTSHQKFLTKDSIIALQGLLILFLFLQITQKGNMCQKDKNENYEIIASCEQNKNELKSQYEIKLGNETRIRDKLGESLKVAQEGLNECLIRQNKIEQENNEKEEKIKQYEQCIGSHRYGCQQCKNMMIQSSND